MAASPENGDKQVPLDTIPMTPPGGEASSDAAFDKAVTSDPNAEVTVFHDKDNFNVKHPLMHNWTLWFTKPPSGKGDNWYDLLKEVVTLDSVEEFWGVYNNIAPVGELAVKSDYHLFKHGVRPEWEDPQNKHGGRWSYSFYKKDSKSSAAIDELWLWTMLAAIGETLEAESQDDEVMGVVVNVRKGFHRISVWTKTMGKGSGQKSKGGGDNERNKAVLMDIGRKFKEVLKLEASETVEFSGHTESAQSGSTRAKPRFVA